MINLYMEGEKGKSNNKIVIAQLQVIFFLVLKIVLRSLQTTVLL